MAMMTPSLSVVLACAVVLLVAFAPIPTRSLFAIHAKVLRLDVTATIEYDSTVRVSKNFIFSSSALFWYAYDELEVGSLNDGISGIRVFEDGVPFDERAAALYNHTQRTFEVLETPESVLVFYYFEPSKAATRNFTIIYDLHNAVQCNMDDQALSKFQLQLVSPMNPYYMFNVSVQSFLWPGAEDPNGIPTARFVPHNAMLLSKSESVGNATAGTLLRNGAYGSGKIERVSSHRALWFVLAFEVVYHQGAKSWFDFPAWQRKQQRPSVIVALPGPALCAAGTLPLLLLLFTEDRRSMRRRCRRAALAAAVVGAAVLLHRARLEFLFMLEGASIDHYFWAVVALALLLYLESCLIRLPPSATTPT